MLKILLGSLALLLLSAFSAGQTDPADQSALIALWNGFTNRGSLSWFTTLSLCGQTGVTCSSGKVTELRLANKGIYGTIASQIGSLTSLTRLDLYLNGLKGSIPTEIGLLTGLPELNLFSNSLTGSIPTEIGALTGLTRVSLYGNTLSGSIPTEIGSLESLENLEIYDNDLSGSIPTEIGALSSLQYLSLNANELSESIPTEIGALSNLLNLYLYDNNLSGNIPTEIGSLANLTRLTFERNSLSGNIPTEIASLSNLISLSLHSNSLSGSIPTEIGSMTNMQALFLHSNSLSGSIPTEMGLMTGLFQAHLHGNSLSGSIPTQIGSLPYMMELNLQSNSLSGSIPTEIGAWTYLNELQVQDNHLSGSIPMELGARKIFTMRLGGTNHFCPLADYSTWAWNTDFQGSTDCEACAAPFPLCLNGGTCLGGMNEAFTCACPPSFIGNCEETGCSSGTFLHATFPEALTDSIVQGTCLEGYEGNASALCLPSGQLQSISDCQSALPPCLAEEYGTAFYNDSLVMVDVPGTCLPGWFGSPVRDCTADGWSPNVRNHCERIMCASTTEDNANWPQTNSDTATYGTCVSGFKGRPFRDCDGEGTFGPIQNPCMPASQCPPVPNYAYASFEATEAGQTATGTCLPGYEGSLTRECTAAGWSATITGSCTRRLCPASNDGVFSFKTMLSNTRAYGTCVTGTGRPWRACDENGIPGPVQGTCA